MTLNLPVSFDRLYHEANKHFWVEMWKFNFNGFELSKLLKVVENVESCLKMVDVGLGIFFLEEVVILNTEDLGGFIGIRSCFRFSLFYKLLYFSVLY